MRKILLVTFIAFFISSSCTREKEYKEGLIPVSPEKKGSQLQTSSIMPEFNFDNQNAENNKAKTEKGVLENLKKISLKNLFNNNMPFIENKGQLERWHNIKIDRIGDIKFYSQAFGGTAYFGKDGIGIGFYVEHLDKKHKQKSPDDPFEEIEYGSRKNRESLFFYVDHEGRNKKTIVSGWNRKEAKLNYFKGKESEFITDISNYDGVIYNDLYKNIDLKYYLVNDDLTYDYIVKPGGKVSDIKRKFDGVKKIQINSAEELEVHTEWGILTDKKIYAYQIINGKEKEVKIRYKKLSEKSAGFEVIGNYDPSKDLIIDPPTLTFATYVTPGGIDGYIHDIAVDASGNIYAAGWSNGSDNGTLVTPFDNGPAGGDAVVFKLRNDGVSVLYASYIGGDGNGGVNEVAWGVAVNSANQLYVAGHTDVHTNFPAAGTPLAPPAAGSQDIFVVKINAAGNALIYSTFYGGTGDDRAYDIEVNASDQAFITGWTSSTASFSTGGAYQTAHAGGTYDAFILKISDATAGTVVRNYCTYLGGNNEDMGRAIAVNSDDAFITGVTQSTNLPTNVGATFGGGSGGGAFDAYVARITGGNTRVYCTYVGGDFDEKAEGIAVRTSTNEAYITGWTKSIVRAASGPGSFPIVNAITGYTQNADAAGNNRDVFMTRLNATGTIVNSTFMGGLGDDNVKNGVPLGGTVQHRGSNIAVNASGNVAVLMATSSTTLPLVSPVDNSYNGGATGLGDAYVFVLGTDAQTVLFSTYFGGTDNDYPTAGVKFDPSSADCIIIGGATHSLTLPTTAGVYGTTRKNAGNAGPDEHYVAKYCTVILPVELTTFTAHLAAPGKVLVEWITSMEKNNDHFEIQRSADGINFVTIGMVQGAGNSTESLSYSFWDEDPLGGLSYYRLRQVDYDGTASLSKIATVNISVLDHVKIYPNPADGMITISNVFDASSEIEIKIINSIGQELLTIKESVSEGAYEKTIDLSQFDGGMYVVQIQTESESKVEKLVKK